MDTNFTDLRDGIGGLQIPKTQNTGIKVDSLGTPTFAWHDLTATLYAASGGQPATFNTYRNGIRQWQFVAESDELFCDFHLPHDYDIGTDLHIHVHWSHASATVTGGSVTWAFELTYAKGHDQGAFPASKTVTVQQNASTTQYQHMVAETTATTVGGSGTQFDTDDMEPDGLLICRFYLDSNDITDSVVVPDPFVHAVDVHYQSTGVGTKAKVPDFWT
jgi:hypothetical protein